MAEEHNHSHHGHQHHHHGKRSEARHGHMHHKQGDDTGMHDKHAGHHTADFLKRFWICLVLTVPVLLLSHMIQQWLGVSWRFSGDTYLLLALSSVIYFYGGWPFLDGMLRELRWRSPGMMTLVAVAITTAYVYSVAVILVCREWISFGN
jgi:Cu2+-exporting ATPase